MSDVRKKLGQAGEQLAASLLKKKGYNIIQQNFRCRAGELDLIAEDGDYLVIVEVKTRSGNSYGSAAEAVGFRKQRQICRTTRHYLHQHAIVDRNIRFDVVAITAATESPVIDHIIDAFDYLP